MNQQISPEKLNQLGKEQFDLEAFADAANHFQMAAEAYRTQGDEISAAKMANSQSVALLMAEDFEASEAAIGNSVSVFAAAGDTRSQAMALGNHAAALAGLNQKAKAEELYWESAKLLESLGEKDLRAAVLKSISKLQLGEGRYMEALASMESGLENASNKSFSKSLLSRLTRFLSKLLNRN